VAIAAEELKVLKPVVRSIAIDVVQGHTERLSHPLGQPASFALVVLDAGTDQPSLEVTPAGSPPRHE
jgi:hypothetical protein